jgi:hypothetical protein
MSPTIEVIYAIPCQSEYPGRGRERGGQSQKTRFNLPVHARRSEARGCLSHRRQWSTDGAYFLEMQEASQIPAIVEPWFLAFNARIEVHPVMVPDDLAKADSAFEAAVKKYASPF